MVPGPSSATRPPPADLMPLVSLVGLFRVLEGFMVYGGAGVEVRVVEGFN